MIPFEVEIPRSIGIAGVTTRTSNAREADLGRARIGRLWQRFFEEGHAARGTGAIFSAYVEYESDVNGEYTVVLGREVSDTTGAQAVIPPGRYLVFSSAGAMPDAVVRGWADVWEYFSKGDAPERSYVADFELYEEAAPDEVRIHVGIERAPA